MQSFISVPKLEAQIGGAGGFCFMGLVLLNSDKMIQRYNTCHTDRTEGIDSRGYIDGS